MQTSREKLIASLAGVAAVSVLTALAIAFSSPDTPSSTPAPPRTTLSVPQSFPADPQLAASTPQSTPAPAQVTPAAPQPNIIAQAAKNPAPAPSEKATALKPDLPVGISKQLYALSVAPAVSRQRNLPRSAKNCSTTSAFPSTTRLPARPATIRPRDLPIIAATARRPRVFKTSMANATPQLSSTRCFKRRNSGMAEPRSSRIRPSFQS